MDLSAREISSLLGMVAFGLILFRLVSTWAQTVVLVHVLGILIVTSLVISAAGSYALDRIDAPPSEFEVGSLSVPIIWAVVAHRVACIIVAIFWRHWMERRHSPLRRVPKTDEGGGTTRVRPQGRPRPAARSGRAHRPA